MLRLWNRLWHNPVSWPRTLVMSGQKTAISFGTCLLAEVDDAGQVGISNLPFRSCMIWVISVSLWRVAVAVGFLFGCWAVNSSILTTELFKISLSLKSWTACVLSSCSRYLFHIRVVLHGIFLRAHFGCLL